MKITKISLYKIKGANLMDKHSPVPSFFLDGFYIIKIFTNQGILGFGEPSPYAAPEKNIISSFFLETFKSLIGIDPINVPVKLTAPQNLPSIDKAAFKALNAGIMQAIWDIRGKFINLPIYKMLDSSSSGQGKVYASGGMWYEDSDPITLVEEALKSKEEGFFGYKFRPSIPRNSGDHFSRNLNPPFVNIEQTKLLAKTLRNSLGDDFDLMLDFGCRLDFNQAQDLCYFLDGLDFKFIEEPLVRSAELYKTLCAFSNLKIAGGETAYDFETFMNWNNFDALDIFQPDSNLCSIDDIKKLDQKLSTSGSIVMHNWVSDISCTSNFHVGVSLRSCDLIEYSILFNPFRETIVNGTPRPQKGWITCSNNPGLGLCIDETLLEAKNEFIINLCHN